MRGGANTLLVTAALAATACAPGASTVEIRPIADPSAKLKSGGPHLDLARGQLALGNVGLALEGFRIALREQPGSIEALAGIAACYSTMGRFDLARQNLEAALAISPNDPGLLSALAVSLDSQGLRTEAAEVRAEVTQLQSASAALDAREIEPEPQAAVAAAAPARPATKIIPAPPTLAAPVVRAAPAGPTVTVKLPPARPLQAPVPVRAAAVQAQPSLPRVPAQLPRAIVDIRSEPSHFARIPLAAVTVRAEPSLPRVPAQLPQAMVDVRSEPPRLARIPLAAVVQAASASVTVALPPARPAEVAVAQTRPSPPRAPLHLPEAVVDVRSAPSSPHLERMSLGEVALITYDRPTAWRPTVVARTAQATTVRWVPLREASARPNIRLLNAARAQGLAARTRSYLLGRGWRKIAIGDASQVRATSVVYYPAHRQATARSLAAQFGFRATQATKGNELVVLLGRDASARRALQTRG